MNGSVTKTTFDNGLTIILKEMHHAPVACFMVWYKVGSRNERAGITGISHWVEHLLFTGTPKFPGPECERLISKEGGYWNAFTWLDHTTYFETMPADRIELGIQIESDRMVNAIMSLEHVESERSIILAERAMYENEPGFVLNEELTSIAFRVHPYHHEVIGDEIDLRTMTRENLYDHYRRYYVPNNAVVVVTGDFETEAMLELIKRHFANIPPGEPIIDVIRQEPQQRGERRVVVEGPGDTSYLEVAYRAPSASHPDYFALVLLNAIFTGGSSLGTLIGVDSNRSSRLYKALVDSDLAISAIGSLSPTIDTFLYSISIVVRDGISLREVEVALDKEIEDFKNSPIAQTDLDKALKRAKAQFVMAGESISGQAQLLGLAEITAGDYRWYDDVLDRLAAVSIDDLNRVRDIYIQKKYRTVGWFQPEN